MPDPARPGPDDEFRTKIEPVPVEGTVEMGAHLVKAIAEGDTVIVVYAKEMTPEPGKPVLGIGTHLFPGVGGKPHPALDPHTLANVLRSLAEEIARTADIADRTEIAQPR